MFMTSQLPLPKPHPELMTMRSCLLFSFLLLIPSVASAQPWPTTDWHVVAKDGSELAGAYVAHGQTFGEMLEEASAWYQSMGYRAPDMERSERRPGAFLARLKDDPTDITSGNTYFPDRSPANRMRLTANLGMTSPSTPIERLMRASPVHELFHAVQWSYSAYATARPDAGVLPSCGTGTDANRIGWFAEGTASALQVRWIEQVSGSSYTPYGDPSRAAWIRYYDQPLHEPRLPESYLAGPRREAERSAGRSWLCGYGTWYFWYAVGELLAETPGQESAYFRSILERSETWKEDGGVAAVDHGLRDAAEAFDSSYRVDEGLYEIYPAFIAEYVDDEQFYETKDAVYLRGGSEVKWRDGTIEPLAAEAFKVTINVRDDLPAGESSRFRVTLDPQPGRDQLHLIEGQVVHRRPLADEDPYQFEVPVRGDTTFFVRLANVAEEATATEGIDYAVRFELGGFYGAPASDPYAAPEVDIPPGFSVMSGPPALVGCSSGSGGQSVFDLITGAEAVGDMRRMVDENAQGLEDMEEALDDGEFLIPGASPTQREAMAQAIESGQISPEEIARLRAALEKAQGQMAEVRRDVEADAVPTVARQYRGRSQLLVNLVGQAGDETCHVMIFAGLRGEEGGAQQLTVEDDQNTDRDTPLPVGISDVGYLSGSSMLEAMQSDDRFRTCMMTPREQESEAQTRCPVVCSGGQLTLERAAQDHAKGTLQVDLVRTAPDRRDARDCPLVDRRELVVGFNITSANQGPDADPLQGISDEAFRLLGMDQATIDMLRGIYGGRFFR